jgi:oxygen-dependent protoporphyrinogen oxidase
LIRCYVGRSGAEEWTALSDEEIVKEVRREIAELLDIHAEPLFHTLTRLNRSMPNYPVGHLETVREARAELHQVMPQVFLTGAAFHGVGLPDCVGQAKQTAEQLIDSLKNNQREET